MARKFKDLSEREILALGIALEEEDSRIYGDFADGLRATYPATAKMFDEMQEEENGHRRSLIDTFRERFGEHIPLIRRTDVKGFVQHRPVWLMRPLGIDTVRKQAEVMELESRRFYECAMAKVSDASVRKLLGDLAEVERPALGAGGILRAEVPDPGCTPSGRCRESPAVCSADHPAGPGGIDGWIRVHAGSGLRCRIRHAQQPGRLSSWLGGFTGSGYFHGIRRGAFRRRLTDRARTPMGTRGGLRPDDGDGRHRPYTAFFNSRFPAGHDGGRHRGGGGTGRHQLHPPPVYGYAATLRRFSSYGGWGAGFHHGNFDWKLLNDPMAG